MISWADLNFPPLNLWNWPYQIIEYKYQNKPDKPNYPLEQHQVFIHGLSLNVTKKTHKNI